MTVALITHTDCHRHQMDPYHPEQPARLEAIHNRLISSGLDFVLLHFDAPKANREQLLAIHDEEYIDLIFAASPDEGMVRLDDDTAMNPHSLEAALRSVGAVTHGVDLLMQQQARQAFCLTRPPGHHAERRRAMGFCLFNNIAAGAYHAINAHGLKRVAIVDFDVHHGNGTEDIVKGDERILFCSSFQHPFYPGSGYDSNHPNVINLPLPALTNGTAFREVVSERWIPQIEEFAPQLILISAGFDGHRDDDMASFNLLEDDYAWITRQLCQLATLTASGRVLSTLEGGYELFSLARSVEAHIRAMYD